MIKMDGDQVGTDPALAAGARRLVKGTTLDACPHCGSEQVWPALSGRAGGRSAPAAVFPCQACHRLVAVKVTRRGYGRVLSPEAALRWPVIRDVREKASVLSLGLLGGDPLACQCPCRRRLARVA